MTSKLLLFITLSIFSTPVYSFNNTNNDKDKHFAASMLIATGTYIYFKKKGHSKKDSAKYGFYVSITVGIIKELTDDKFDREDLLADTIGAGVPLFTVQF